MKKVERLYISKLKHTQEAVHQKTAWYHLIWSDEIFHAYTCSTLSCRCTSSISGVYVSTSFVQETPFQLSGVEKQIHVFVKIPCVKSILKTVI